MSQTYRKKRVPGRESDENSDKARTTRDTYKDTYRRHSRKASSSSSSSSRSASSSAKIAPKESTRHYSSTRQSSSGRYDRHASRFETEQKYRNESAYESKYIDEKAKNVDEKKRSYAAVENSNKAAYADVRGRFDEARRYDERYSGGGDVVASSKYDYRERYDSRVNPPSRYDPKYDKFDPKYDVPYERYPRIREDKYAYHGKYPYREYDRYDYEARPKPYDRFYPRGKVFRGGFRGGFEGRSYPYKKDAAEAGVGAGDEGSKKFGEKLTEFVDKVDEKLVEQINVPGILEKSFTPGYVSKFKNIRYIPKKDGGNQGDGGSHGAGNMEVMMGASGDKGEGIKGDGFANEKGGYGDDAREKRREGDDAEERRKEKNEGWDESVCENDLEISTRTKSPSFSSSATEMDDDDDDGGQHQQVSPPVSNSNQQQQRLVNNINNKNNSQNNNNYNYNKTQLANIFSQPLSNPEYVSTMHPSKRPSATPLFLRPEFCQGNDNHNNKNNNNWDDDDKKLIFNVSNNLRKADTPETKFDLRMKLSSSKLPQEESLKVNQYQSVRRVVESDKRNDDRIIVTL